MKLTSGDVAAFLKRIKLFYGLPPAFLQSLAKRIAVIRRTRNSILFKEGGAGNSLYIIYEGSVLVEANGVRLLTRSAGECVGEFSILDGSPRSSTVSADSNAVLLRLERKDFLAVLRQNPQVAGRITRMLTAKLRQDVAIQVEADRRHNRVIQELRLQRDAALATLNRLALGVILLDRHGDAIYANGRADTILRRKNGLLLESSTLRASHSAENNRLRQFIQSAAETGCGNGSDPGASLTLTRTPAEPPLHLMIAPVEARHSLIRNQIPAAVIFISDPGQGELPPEDLLQKAFGLTPAETRLVRRLLLGKTLDESAKESGTAVSTARSHLRSIFNKTRTSRQSDLLRLVLTSPAVLASARLS